MRRRPPRSTRFPDTTLFRSPGVGESPVERDEPLVEAIEVPRGVRLLGVDVHHDVGGYVRHERVAPYHVERRRSEEHTSELQSRQYLVCRLLLEKKNTSSPTT